MNRQSAKTEEQIDVSKHFKAMLMQRRKRKAEAVSNPNRAYYHKNFF